MNRRLFVPGVVLCAGAMTNAALAAVNNITQATVHITLQDAIDNAVDGDVLVADPWIYVETIDFSGLAITLRSASGDPANTTIDGSGTGPVVTCATGEGPDTILSGFTITGGSAADGAGMVCDATSPTVSDCVFSANVATNHGGGMRNQNGANPTITDCVFTGNSALLGGGMSNENSSPKVADCRFYSNEVTGIGSYGGAVYNDAASPTVTNCIFSGNDAESLAGAMYNIFSSAPAIANCTFSLNSAGNDGGAIRNTNDSSPALSNCILWGNTPNQVANLDSSAPSFAFCDIQGGIPAGSTDLGGNVDTDPRFVDAAGPDGMAGTLDDDLRLLNPSPCIDAGNDALLPAVADAGFNSAFGLAAIPSDLAGNQRVFNSPFVPGVTQTVAGAPALAIPDSDLSGVTTNILVAAGPSSIDRVELGIGITHTYIRDLIIALESPMGTLVAAWNRSCGDFDDMDATFGDGFLFPTCASPFSGQVTSDEALAAFAGEPADGTWILTVIDAAPFDTGTLDAFALTFKSSAVDLGAYENQSICFADLNFDGVTDVFDFAIFGPSFGTSLGDPGFVPAADLNADDTIDIFDFALFGPDFGCPD